MQSYTHASVLPGPGPAFLLVHAESSANFQEVRPFFEKVLFAFIIQYFELKQVDFVFSFS